MINKTSGTIVLKEGTQGVYRAIFKLDSGCHYDIKADPNSIYREYRCAAKDDDPNHTVLSSDDCHDHRIIEIYCVEGTYKWRPIKTTEASGSGEARKKVPSAVAWVKSIFTGGEYSHHTKSLCMVRLPRTSLFVCGFSFSAFKLITYDCFTFGFRCWFYLIAGMRLVFIWKSRRS